MVIILLFISVPMFAKTMKIGVLDFQKVIAQSEVAKKMNKKIESKFKDRQLKLVDKQSKYEEKTNQLKRNESVMKKSQVKKLTQEIDKLRSSLELESQDFQRDLQEAQTKASQKFSNRVQVEIDKIGDKGGFDLILQKQATAYVKNDSDVTDKLIQAMK